MTLLLRDMRAQNTRSQRIVDEVNGQTNKRVYSNQVLSGQC